MARSTRAATSSAARQLAEVPAAVPRLHRQALHDAVCVVALQARLHERQQQPLAEVEAVARIEVLAHAFPVDDEAVDEPREAVEHVVEGEERIGDDDALGGRVRDVALVPESDVLQADLRRAAHDAREAADPLGGDRIALVRHRRGALLAGGERLLDLADLGAREVADLEAEGVERRGDDGEHREELRVPVALDDLRGVGCGLEAQTLAREPLELRAGGRVRADGAGELADPHPLERTIEARTPAIELERPAGELQPERRRLGMDAVRAAHDQRPAVLLGPGDDGFEGAVEALDEERSGLAHLKRERGVEHVRGGEAVVEPAPSLRVEPFADRIDEGGEVVARPSPRARERVRASAPLPALCADRATCSGTTPSSAQASSAASSTSSQRSSLCSSDQTLAMAGRE